MSLGTYLEERAGVLLTHAFSLLASAAYLWLTGTKTQVIICLDTIWILFVGIWAVQGYYREKKYLEELEKLFDALPEKYLFAEILPAPKSAVGRQYFAMCREAGKAMIEHIDEAERSAQEYREYVEGWIHEVKNPISAMDLYCRNHPGEDMRLLQNEVRNMERLVRQTLYCARLGSAQKDYLVRECSLTDALIPALQSCRGMILEKHLKLQVQEDLGEVCTDTKWVSFILEQILSNAVKYTRADEGIIEIYTEQDPGGVWLWVRDNGCGIPPEDLPRVCERGFTGSDRSRRKATGMGLYLAKELCRKLGLSFFIDSAAGEGTRAGIGFPVGTLVKP